MCTRAPGYVAVFAIGDAGRRLTPVEFVLTGGPNPRECALSPSADSLLVVDQSNGTLTAYARHPATGRLTLRAHTSGLVEPSAVAVWVPPPGGARAGRPSDRVTLSHVQYTAASRPAAVTAAAALLVMGLVALVRWTARARHASRSSRLGRDPGPRVSLM